MMAPESKRALERFAEYSGWKADSIRRLSGSVAHYYAVRMKNVANGSIMSFVANFSPASDDTLRRTPDHQGVRISHVSFFDRATGKIVFWILRDALDN